VKTFTITISHEACQTMQLEAVFNIDLALRGTTIPGGQYWADGPPRAANPRMRDERLCAAFWEASLAAVAAPAAQLPPSTSL
jgi:hypothetical protein